jgi:8-oxo-dGTP pyrophosphatase MutT (NUDIX family)/RimJ/RimL family protein N-acetyltransferase
VKRPLRYTYDGVPIAPDQPYGAAIIVRRPAASDSQAEYLVLHRAHRGPAYAGDWAWTPPSGSRQPGEAVLTAALRELAEETGLMAASADLRVLDLSGPWVRFALDVPAGTTARVDPEHDRLEWLGLDDAISRCQPATVADGLRVAAAATTASLAFRPLATADLPALLSWQRAPHAMRWLPERLDLVAAQRKYGPRIAGESPVRVHVLVVDGRDCGFAQHYQMGDVDPAAAEPDEIGIDYGIGVAELTGHGLGPQLIWNYARDVVRPAYPAVRYVVASPDTANHRSIRALAKSGFDVTDSRPDTTTRCVLDVVKFFGNGPGLAGNLIAGLAASP